MADNLQKAGQQDRSRINVNERWELQYWTKELGVSEDELRRVVQEVGPSVSAVRARLKK
ncbi:MAG: DUF3606 domain-containing protein [Telluria sp.]|jgi:hypothetical protein